MNMFKPVGATSVEEYLAKLPKDGADDMRQLHDIIQKTVPQLKSHFAYNMLGYGSFKYLNYKKQTVDWPVVALAKQKNYISIYVCALHEGMYIAELHKEELGKVSVGKSCIRFRRVSDLNLSGLKKVLRLAAKYPGLVSTKKS